MILLFLGQDEMQAALAMSLQEQLIINSDDDDEESDDEFSAEANEDDAGCCKMDELYDDGKSRLLIY